MSDTLPTEAEKKMLADAGLEVQPEPISNGGPSAHDLVIADQTKRKQYGLDKYNSLLQPFNGRDQLQDAYEESLDLCVYLRTAIEERNLIAAQDLEYGMDGAESLLEEAAVLERAAEWYEMNSDRNGPNQESIVTPLRRDAEFLRQAYRAREAEAR